MFKAIGFILKEHRENYRQIIKMALINTEKQTVRSSLGILWTYFHDIVYILVFIMFRLLISGFGKIDGMNSIVYLLTGLIPWFFISDMLNQGSRAILSNKGIVQSIRFPITILPTIEVLSIVFRRFFTFFILLIALTLFGYLKCFSVVLFFYYFIALVYLMVSMNLLLSAFVAVSEDFHQLYLAIVRVIIYSLPIMWSYDKVDSTIIHILLRINPMVYVIRGFRNVFVQGMTQNIEYSAYFWISITAVFALGCYAQYKLRKHYADFI
nr:ABC transporter permease [uncultured Acetatifactor sp.]